ncbi:TAXI family TRAP transporter solute-binding subunit [Polynucleobacter sp. MWH-P3-07-1]|uniref:TAXI family TRAP transporter solute-binding subunit n=1 Tax=Polynucleobacter sp. MWH-P3-07-1 TaxID=1743173 RepID=UPI001BFD2864|nr:TAXI family TRAP transporter solute-binding subunit [Polynucleobacter sp. MWH-P3-07-1]QWD82785.1 TAXI family TRAP transporter solute-binding subunit [Polynucleobacter sp. MWH-P3-07-1]
MTKKQAALYIAGLGILIAIAVAVVELFLLPPNTVDIAAGPKGTFLYETAQKYAQEFEKAGVKVNVIETNGTLENIALVNHDTKNIEFGFIEGGAANSANYPNLESLGSIVYAPVWVFYQSKLGKIQDINDLKGKRIAIGFPTQGIHANATQILKAVGITAQNSQFLDLGRQDALKALDANEIDAMFTSAPAEDPLIKKLFNSPGIEVLNWPDAEGISRNMREFHVLTLPMGTIDLIHNKPANNMNLLATTFTVVAQKETHSALIYLMMGIMDDVHQPPSFLHGENEFPADRDVDFPLSSDAQNYYAKGGKPFLQKHLPYWAASFVGKLLLVLVPLLAIIYPFSQAYPALTQWFYTRRVNRFYLMLVKIEKRFDQGGKREIAQQELESLRAEIDALIKQEKIPSSYTNLLYDLREHVAQVMKRYGIN